MHAFCQKKVALGYLWSFMKIGAGESLWAGELVSYWGYRRVLLLYFTFSVSRDKVMNFLQIGGPNGT